MRYPLPRLNELGMKILGFYSLNRIHFSKGFSLFHQNMTALKHLSHHVPLPTDVAHWEREMLWVKSPIFFLLVKVKLTLTLGTAPFYSFHWFPFMVHLILEKLNHHCVLCAPHGAWSESQQGSQGSDYKLAICFHWECINAS